MITYMQKEEVSELNGDLTMKSLFADFPFEMNGSIVICDDDKVVSTNKQELLSSSAEESKSLYKNEFKAGGMKLSAFIQRPETGMDARRRLKTMMHISFSRKARFTSHEISYV